MAKKHLWLVLLILLVAAAFRLVGLTSVPPGLTHDEADHGQDAWGVVNGERPIYFTVGYGREPLFDYATASVMSITGPSFLAGRLTAVYFSMILIAGSYAWVSRAFGFRTALLTVAGLAVSFIGVMTGRQALRSITLPALFVLAVLLYWRGMQLSEFPARKLEGDNQLNPRRNWVQITQYFLAGVLLGLTVYTYPPARILWLLFPLFILFLFLFDRDRFRRTWQGTALTLLTAAIIVVPLVLYLLTNPSAETRITELSLPIQALVDGDFKPLANNIVGGLKLLAFEGDNQWRYNIAGRPVLQPVVALFFFGGLCIVLWRIVLGIRDRRKIWPAAVAFFALVWLLLGLSPALVTGTELSTTRIVGLLPVLFLFPALALTTVLDKLQLPQRVAYGFIGLLFIIVGVLTIRDYFFVWADSPEVRVQYETTTVTAINYLNDLGQGQAALSTTTPDRFHSPAVGLLTQNNSNVKLRWFNGLHSFLVPHGEESTILFTGFSPLNPVLMPYFSGDRVDQIFLGESDLDQPITVYDVDGRDLLTEWQLQFEQDLIAPNGAVLPAMFGDAVELLGYVMPETTVTPGEDFRLITLWRALQPVDEAITFIHVLDADGFPIAQVDRLDVPSYSWEDGDLFLQLHEMTIPATTDAGEYSMAAGIYTREDMKRLPVQIDGQITGDHLRLLPLNIGP